MKSKEMTPQERRIRIWAITLFLIAVNVVYVAIWCIIFGLIVPSRGMVLAGLSGFAVTSVFWLGIAIRETISPVIGWTITWAVVTIMAVVVAYDVNLSFV